MKNVISKIFTVGILAVCIVTVFVTITVKKDVGGAEVSQLVIFGENIVTTHKPFIKNGSTYISTETIGKTIDENIFYDKVSTKVIITTHSDVIKLKVGEKRMSRNLEYTDIQNEVLIVDSKPYIPIELVTDIYSIKVGYNENTNTISIDKKETSDITIKHNRVNVYSDISTKSDVLETLYIGDTVTIYLDSLKHARWYKVKTDTGIVGYISKNNVDGDFNVEEGNKEDNNNTDNNSNKNEKLTMFWQYGSDLNTLEKNKIDGVDVVSPTWYELKNSNGEINSKFNAQYYNQAKSFGYEIWPIITNGIDSASYTAGDTSTMVNSEHSREEFIKNLLEICKANKLDGINIDFEAMRTEDREIYTQFIRELSPILRKQGVKVSVDMYFVAYIDRKGVGAAADYVVLMGYDQRGTWSNQAGSIAEATWVEQNIESLINDSKIPAEKIILGVPFYTRLWTEKKGGDKPTTKVYTMQNCIEFINKYKLSPTFDETAGQNYVEYAEGDLKYRLWIEDKVSTKRRVETVNKYNLAGITGWRKGFETDDIFQTIKDNLK